MIDLFGSDFMRDLSNSNFAVNQVHCGNKVIVMPQKFSCNVALAKIASLNSVLEERGVNFHGLPRLSTYSSITLLASSNPIDLITELAQAVSDAKSGDWVSAAADSIEVAKDLIAISQEVGNAFIDSRIDAVQSGYAENSDIGFQ